MVYCKAVESFRKLRYYLQTEIILINHKINNIRIGIVCNGTESCHISWHIYFSIDMSPARQINTQHDNWEIVWIRGNFTAFVQIRGVGVTILSYFHSMLSKYLNWPYLHVWHAWGYCWCDKATSSVEITWKLHKFSRFIHD